MKDLRNQRNVKVEKLQFFGGEENGNTKELTESDFTGTWLLLEHTGWSLYWQVKADQKRQVRARLLLLSFLFFFCFVSNKISASGTSAGTLGRVLSAILVTDLAPLAEMESRDPCLISGSWRMKEKSVTRWNFLKMSRARARQNLNGKWRPMKKMKTFRWRRRGSSATKNEKLAGSSCAPVSSAWCVT